MPLLRKAGEGWSKIRYEAANEKGKNFKITEHKGAYHGPLCVIYNTAAGAGEFIHKKFMLFLK